MADPYAACVPWGGMTGYNWEHDPKRLAFQFARYKFVAKMLAGMGHVLEVGCADGAGARIVRQHVSSLLAVDVDEAAIRAAIAHASARWPVNFAVHDILQAPIPGFDAVYCLDLFEHIVNEDRLIESLRQCAPVAIIGTPSLESQAYASEISRAEHVNCKSGEALRAAVKRHFSQAFLFGMNDEVVHTGFAPMCHYLFVLAVA